MKNREFRNFVTLTYAISWLFLGSFVVIWHTYMNQKLTWWTFLFLPGAYGPSIAAIFLVGRLGGWESIRRLLGKILLWRVQARWYAFALLAPLSVVAVSVVLSGFRMGTIQRFDIMAGITIAPLAFLIALPFGPIGEELGWRGYALPKLLETNGLWKSSIILGLIWTFWHLPMFWFPGAAIPSFLSPTPVSIGLYSAQITAEACLMTFLYTVTRGSVLLAILYHASFNSAENIVFHMIPELTADQELTIYVISILLSWILAAILLTIASQKRSSFVTQIGAE